MEYLQAAVLKNDIRFDSRSPFPPSIEEIEIRAANYINSMRSTIKYHGGPENFAYFLKRMSRRETDRQQLHPGRISCPGVFIHNVRDLSNPFTVGRKLSDDILLERGLFTPNAEADTMMQNTFFDFNGLCKTYLNPDALWLMVYTTPVESYTTRLYTPITPQNIDILSRIPYHPDFPKPPHWTGKTGALNKNYSEELANARANYKKIKSKMRVIE